MFFYFETHYLMSKCMQFIAASIQCTGNKVYQIIIHIEFNMAKWPCTLTSSDSSDLKKPNSLLMDILTRFFFLQKRQWISKFHEGGIMDIITMHSVISARCKITENINFYTITLCGHIGPIMG